MTITTDSIRWNTVCPACGHGALQFGEVETFARAETDGETTAVAVSRRAKSRTGTGIDDTEAPNPSSRKSAVRIELFCAGCRSEMVLDIAEHPGAKLAGETELVSELRVTVQQAPPGGRRPHAARHDPIAGAAGLPDKDLDALAGRLRGHIAPCTREALAANRDDHRLATHRQLEALRRHTGITDGDLVRLGVRVGRLDPDAEQHAYTPWPLNALRRDEAGALMQVSYTLRYAAPPAAGANVVAFRRR